MLGRKLARTIITSRRYFLARGSCGGEISSVPSQELLLSLFDNSGAYDSFLGLESLGKT
jgi:hypothetical protein